MATQYHIPGENMEGNLTKRQFLRLSSVGGVAAAMGLITGRQAEADTLPPEHDLPPPEENVAELAQSLAAIGYIATLAFAIGAIIKFQQHKDNPTQSARLIAVVWALIDESTAASLAALGYSPQFVLDALQQAQDGDPSDLIGFFSDLKLLAG
jgi:hypothetical protein